MNTKIIIGSFLLQEGHADTKSEDLTISFSWTCMKLKSALLSSSGSYKLYSRCHLLSEETPAFFCFYTTFMSSFPTPHTQPHLPDGVAGLQWPGHQLLFPPWSIISGLGGSSLAMNKFGMCGISSTQGPLINAVLCARCPRLLGVTWGGHMSWPHPLIIQGKLWEKQT